MFYSKPLTHTYGYTDGLLPTMRKKPKRKNRTNSTATSRERRKHAEKDWLDTLWEWIIEIYHMLGFIGFIMWIAWVLYMLTK